MLRVLTLAAIICVFCVMSPSMAATIPSQSELSDIENSSPANEHVQSLVATDSVDAATDLENQQQERFYYPAEDRKPRVIEEFNHQFLDGSYEYKYVLSNGVTRYEKSYWKPVGHGKQLLARKGFYSHPLTNHKYLTVFYTADERGYQQDTAKFTKAVPALPKHLNVPQLEIPHEPNKIKATATATSTTTTVTATTATTQKPKTTRKITTRKPKVSTTQRPPVKPSPFNWIY